MKRFISFLFFFSFFFSLFGQVIVLLPAGHQDYFGRTINGQYERGLSYRFLEAVQKACKSQEKQVIVPLNTQGNVYNSIDHVNYLQPTLVVQVGLYEVTESKPTVSCFVRTIDYLRDTARTESSDGESLDIRYVYQEHFFKSWMYAKKMTELMRAAQGQIDILGLCGAPLKTMQGCLAPSLYIEIGIASEQQLFSLVDLIAQSIGSL